MATRTNTQRLNEIPAKTGRQITEDSDIINNSQKTILDFFSNASELALVGRLNFIQTVATVNSNTSRLFVIKTGSNHVSQFARNITVSANFWDIEVLSGGFLSGGILQTIRNTRLGEPAYGNTAEIYLGGTLTGEAVVATDFIAGSSQNKSGGLSGGSDGAILIYPPDSTFAVRLTNTGNSSAKISFQYIFSEITPQELTKLRTIYVG